MMGLPFFFTYHTDLERYADYAPFKGAGITLLKKLVIEFMKRADMVIFPGQAIRNSVARHTREINPIVLPTGIRNKTMKHQKAKERYVLQVGRLCKERRVDVLLRAFKRLNAPRLKMYITSQGPDAESLKELSRKLGIDDRTRFLGYVDERKKTELYRRAEVFVTTSPSDTQGMVALEAMQYGTPVIAARAGGFLDYIEEGRNGLFFRPNDYRDLAKKLAVLIDDKALWRRLSANGYRTVKECDMKVTADKLLNIYRGIAVLSGKTKTEEYRKERR
jgi:glycosyltransferase involved in cell wall biosynthesis